MKIKTTNITLLITVDIYIRMHVAFSGWLRQRLDAYCCNYINRLVL